MIGRHRSLSMRVVGALVLGLPDSYASGYLPSDNQYLTTFRFVIPTVVLFVVLLALPNPQLRTRATSASREHVPLPSWRTALLTAGVLIGASAVLAGILTDSDALRVTRILGLALEIGRATCRERVCKHV